jgi:hypothetical protein
VIIGLTTVGLSVVSSTALSASQSRGANPKGPIQLTVPSGGGAQFLFESFLSCQIGDGLVIVKNLGNRSARITGVSMDVPSTAKPTKDQTTFQVEPISPGATTGEIATNFSLTAIPQLAPPQSAVGAVLKPFAKNGHWYAIIARMRVRTVHRNEWVIRGMRVTLIQGKTTSHLFFPQVVRLPSDNC